MKKKILVIDDEEMVLETIQLVLGDMGCEVVTANDPIVGLNEVKNNEFDLIISDLRMPTKTGADITADILKIRPNARILILTAYPTDPLAKKALDVGALSLLKKPFEVAKILDFLNQ